MRKKICFVVAVPITVQAFLRDHINGLSKQYDVYILGNVKAEDVANVEIKGFCHINMERGICIGKDLKSVWEAYRYFRKIKFDAIHSVTPKAGLVSALAGWLARIPHRTHIFTGQVWATSTGLMRLLLKSLDKVISCLDNHIMVDGKSQRAFLVKEGVLKEGQALVFAHGSISGVNSVRFVPDSDARKEIRAKVGIKEGVLCFIFLGRLNHDKGIGELYEAFDRLAAKVDDVFLLLVGLDEQNYIGKVSNYKNIKEGRNFHYYGLTSNPEKVLNAGDVFTLPTYREGFGTSLLEAACIGLPCISTDAYGVVDAYIDGETGLRCKVGDVETLYNCMKRMYENPDMVKKMGENSRIRALRDFKGSDLTACWVDFYDDILR